MATTSLRIELLRAASERPRPVKDLIADGLRATGWEKVDGEWRHPEKLGKTPTATASAAILKLQQQGLLEKPAVGMVARVRAERKRIKEIIEGASEEGSS